MWRSRSGTEKKVTKLTLIITQEYTVTVSFL